ncbi:FAD:protein FMN transferase [Alcaligenaceae bacterium]|nr:FAD:protein FMN transferase [Alcaligenaceae bacterium]
MKQTIQTRRRFIGIIAAASGLAMVPLALRQARASYAPAVQPVIWRGVALGADAELRIYHPDPVIAQKLIDQSVAEVHRLEKIFSLYQEDSALSLLNRQGFINSPPADLLRLLAESQHFSQLTGGAFDPTVQPLWKLYAGHFSTAQADPDGPGIAAVTQALSLVDYSALELDPAYIRYLRPDMAMTLNGIAQGYITDRVTQLLRNAGLDRALIDMGEIQGLNKLDGAEPWKVGLADPDDPKKVFDTVEIRNQALATSGGYGTHLDTAGRFTHIFDPKTGLSQPRYRSVSVTAANATTADALSTAFSTMSLPDAEQVIKKLGVKAWFLMEDGSKVVVS